MKKLLLIDDNLTLLNFLARDLSIYYDVISFSESKLAIEFIQSNAKELNIIVSDYKMPLYNGIEVLKAAKEAAPHSIRLLLTGYIDAVDEKDQKGIYNLIIDKNVIKDARELVRNIEELPKGLK
ncbi:MAG: hypothetical protein DKM50_10275 [Candidatus Margulisiibacteriota bacterium]|nr:MAG: hypothetical protein A2X43_06340 [Candidatus Margulisbacteria bacterium GWD2_39_127]OGI05231.1 MAG: hypothetical protein A2X42_02870 [Candidatus Margulisbacteria bacterium GWF2_38_17]OGI06280.1 MAG: hypothetical protein A2X41_08450 [Candidatus Margulisbacteria bacterium GWE2_39_32]PZM78937.1 MAG: hypothetical protein DKM50_10275 [Candidatus Margulisiibacteriota bacterium]HAR64319.1 hypothetical protein [Candidatus Margulisiibacteriota bacterium]